MRVSGRPLIFPRKFELAPGAMVTFVEEELQPHAFWIVFAASEAMILGKGDVSGVVSGESLGHGSSIIRTNVSIVRGSAWIVLIHPLPGVLISVPLYDFRVLFLTYIPKPPLSQFVELFWFYEGYTQPHAKERIMPDGSMQVVVNLLEDEIKTYHPNDPDRFDRFSGAILAGPRSRFGVIDTASQRCLIGVHFKPGGASRFLKMPISELENSDVSLDCLWGIYGHDLRNRLLETSSPEAKMRVLERCLLERATKPFQQHPAVERALELISQGSPCQSVADIANEIGISRRRFIQVFSEEIGLTPKLFCRIQRFQPVLHHVHGIGDVDWADVALAHGYFDQAHFNHDFRTFSGITPSQYQRYRTEHLNHVPLMD